MRHILDARENFLLLVAFGLGLFPGETFLLFFHFPFIGNKKEVDSGTTHNQDQDHHCRDEIDLGSRHNGHTLSVGLQV
jgi:hypothetical protein